MAGKRKKDVGEKKRLSSGRSPSPSPPTEESKGKKKATAATAMVVGRSEDPDMGIHERALADIRAEEEAKRSTSRMAVLTRMKHSLEDRVKRKEITRQQADELFEKEKEAYKAGKGDGVKNKIGQIVIGADAIPAKNETQTRVNPYAEETVDVGSVKARGPFKKGQIRLNKSTVFSVVRIEFGGSKGQQTNMFEAWSLQKVAKGESADKMRVKADGTKVKVFNFSGPVDSLPELHRALSRLLRTSRSLPWPPIDELAEDRSFDNEDEELDLSVYGREVYTKRVFSFREFRIYEEDSVYIGSQNSLQHFR